MIMVLLLVFYLRVKTRIGGGAGRALLMNVEKQTE